MISTVWQILLLGLTTLPARGGHGSTASHGEIHPIQDMAAILGSTRNRSLSSSNGQMSLSGYVFLKIKAETELGPYKQETPWCFAITPSHLGARREKFGSLSRITSFSPMRPFELGFRWILCVCEFQAVRFGGHEDLVKVKHHSSAVNTVRDSER